MHLIKVVGVLLLMTALVPISTADNTLDFVAEKQDEELAELLQFHSEIIRSSLAESDHEVNFVYRPWARALKEVLEGNLDAAYTAYFNPERAKLYAYTAPYLTSDLVLYKKRDQQITFSGDLTALQGHTIGVMHSWTINPEFDDSELFTKQTAHSAKDLITLLLADRISLFVLDRDVYDIVAKYLEPSKRQQIVAVGPPLASNPNHVIFSKETPDYQQHVETFNQGLKQIIDNGTLDQLKLKYRASN